MNKSLKYILLVCMCMTTAYNSIAIDRTSEDDQYYESNDNEGNLLFKMRIHGIKTNATQKGLPDVPAGITPQATKSLVEDGYGGDTATTVFFGNNLAAELSLGLEVLNVKRTTLVNIAYNYNTNPNTNPVTITKRKKIYMIPLTLTGQYHIAPFGAIRPYVGTGYSLMYLFSQAREFKINNSHGLVLQIGADFAAKDGTFLNIDARYYLLKTKVNYTQALLPNTANKVSSTVNMKPLVISVGLGFKL